MIVPSSSTEVFQRTETGVVLSALSIAFLPLKCRGKKRGPSDSTFKDQAIKNLDHFSFHPALLLPAPFLSHYFMKETTQWPMLTLSTDVRSLSPGGKSLRVIKGRGCLTTTWISTKPRYSLITHCTALHSMAWHGTRVINGRDVNFNVRPVTFRSPFLHRRCQCV